MYLYYYHSNNPEFLLVTLILLKEKIDYKKVGKECQIYI